MTDMTDLTEAQESAILARINAEDELGRRLQPSVNVMMGVVVGVCLLVLALSNRGPDVYMLEATGQLEELSR